MEAIIVNIRRYVVGVDGSIPARAAIRWAIERAHDNSADLTLVHVADDQWGAIGSVLVDEHNQVAMQLLADEVAYAGSLGSDVTIHADLRFGSPMMELSSYSEPSTMLVVGTHKTGVHDDRPFGSRSLQLANLAAGPVAIIPGTAPSVRRGVVVGVDDTPAGRAAIALAADWAHEHHCELTAVRSTVASATPSAFEMKSNVGRLESTTRHDEAQAILKAAVGYAKDRQPGIVVQSRIAELPPGVSLNEFARHAGLLVIGDSRRAQAQFGSLGAVAYDVLLNLTSPTIVVHTPAGDRAPQAETHDAHALR